MFINPMTSCDYYKLGHMTMDVPGVKTVVSTWTPRHHYHDNPQNDYTVAFGAQWAVQRFFIEYFEDFFDGDFEFYVEDFERIVRPSFNSEYLDTVIEAWRDLHELGYLPIAVWAVPEGFLLKDGVPMAMMYNTDRRFGWLPQFLEDLWSNSMWLPSTSATTSYYRRKAAMPYFEQYSDTPNAVRRLCGDFSLRGMTSMEAGAISGAGHALSFDRTATIPANSLLRQYYSAVFTNNEAPLYGLPSLEHSVVEKGVAYFKQKIAAGEDIEYWNYIKKGFDENWEINLIAEMCFILYMLKEVQQTGNFTYVADTYDFWGIIGKVLPTIAYEILSRDGKFIVRPDSGDPVRVILGRGLYTPKAQAPVFCKNEKLYGSYTEQIGALESLSQTFGYTLNNVGMKILNPHIGLIYGDAITAERQEDILRGITERGWAPENITLGIGAYTFQYATRDTRGFAIKATACDIEGIGEIPIFKQPKTDMSKSSQRGAVAIRHSDIDVNVITGYRDGLTIEDAVSDTIMKQIFLDGKTMNKENLDLIRLRLWKGDF